MFSSLVRTNLAKSVGESVCFHVLIFIRYVHI